MSKNNGLDQMKQSQADTRKMLAEWRSNNFHEVELPLSGRILQVRDAGLLDLAIEGQVPNTMLDLVQQLADGKMSETEVMKSHAPEFGDLLNIIFKIAVVFPPVADEPDDDHISPSEFVYGDKMALFNWVNREAVILRPFRGESSEPVAVSPNGEELRKTA